jgi:FlaG/FlaF family flagellin (archaellin)
MVAITVILAAAVATFALSIGDTTTSVAPQATFSFNLEDNVEYNTDFNSYTADKLTITHDGGDTVDSSSLRVRTYGDGIKYVKNNGNLGGSNYRSTWTFEEMGSSSDVSAGTSVTVVTIQQDADDNVNRDVTSLNRQEIYVVYEPPSGDSSATLGYWAGPDE